MFSCKAHVFQLEPELKKSWLALSSTAVNVQIFHDPIKNIYRIVSVEGVKVNIFHASSNSNINICSKIGVNQQHSHAPNDIYKNFTKIWSMD